MNEQPFWAREYHDTTTLHPVGLAAVLLLGSVMLVAPRRYAILPMIAMAVFVAPAQRLVLAGLDFNLIRIMVVFGWARLLVRGECRGYRWHTIDWLLLAWAMSQTMIYTIQHGTSTALINRLGASFDAVGMYFLFRMLIRSWDDVVVTIRGTVLLSLPVLMAFVVENRTGRNMFAFLGGVPEITAIRDGRLRCQGAFAHPILAGTFWAALLPTIAALWWRGGRDKLYAGVGVVSCLALVVLCSSSTPAAAVLLGIVAALMWPLRWWMGYVQIGAVAVLTFMHLSMQAPVWHLIARIDIVGGSTGWHRYNLFDQFIRNFQDWAVVGTSSTAHWGRWGISDITNQYVMEGIRGGLLTLLIFLAIVYLTFRQVGPLWRSAQPSRWQMALAWSFGAAMFVHATAFFAVSYFGQIIVIWYLLLAMIVSLSQTSVLERARIAAAARAHAHRSLQGAPA